MAKNSPSDEIDEYIDIIDNVSENIAEDIKSQRDLAAAESNELQLECETIDSLKIIKGMASKYSDHELCRGKTIEISPSSFGVVINTDKRLLKRVIGNLLKNAIEASPEGSIITISSKANENGAYFWINNPGYISEEHQLQIFARSFSTKGKARGLGTYSVKLLTEKYLDGKVWFKTSEDKGTTFYVCIPNKDTKAQSEAGENNNQDKAS